MCFRFDQRITSYAIDKPSVQSLKLINRVVNTQFGFFVKCDKMIMSLSVSSGSNVFYIHTAGD
jgi:hypothetical protein